jgi:hypothetical protein
MSIRPSYSKGGSVAVVDAERKRATGAIAALALSAIEITDLDVAGVESAMADVGLVRNWMSGLEAKLVLRANALAGQGGVRVAAKRHARAAADPASLQVRPRRGPVQ